MPADTPRAVAQDRQTPPALLTKALIRRYYIPVGERTLDRWISSGTFPRPDIAIGGKVRYWRRETVEAWIDAQAEGGSRE
jgi:hypothetical protein